MNLGIKDRVALVPAASKGIGFAIAHESGWEGARLFLCSRDERRANKVGKPEEIAGALAFLSSERASYITGVTLQVDGGWVRGLF